MPSLRVPASLYALRSAERYDRVKPRLLVQQLRGWQSESPSRLALGFSEVASVYLAHKPLLPDAVQESRC